jgi:type II secretory pathway predicted ATPase ExeA
MEFKPLTLKALAVECDLSQAELQRAVEAVVGRPVSRPTINLCLNRGYIPGTIKGFVAAVEQVIDHHPRGRNWLAERGMTVADIWRPLGEERRLAMPAGQKHRQQQARLARAIAAGDPDLITINGEVEMISQEAMKHFKMFRNPFIDDIQRDSDVYMSDEHRYIEAAMLDASRHGGFLAVIGEVGSGKSVMRRKVVEQLKRDGDTLVIYPQIIDKTRLTAASICDAIIQDVSNEKCRAKLEDKTRQVQRLLLDRAKSGYRACLIVEEAHDLNVNTLKYLKRFYELEDGYKKLLGIILIGQTELKHMFNESQNVDMREVIRRVQVAEIRGLNGHLKDYLSVKFKRVGKNPEEIFGDDAYEAMSKRLTSLSRDGKGKISHAYPLTVNNHVARALNLAQEMGEARVTADVIDAI